MTNIIDACIVNMCFWEIYEEVVELGIGLQ
jgi:hypothetical protein